MALMSRSCPASVLLKPAAEFTRIGKKQIRATIRIFDLMPKPNQMISSGAMATFGMVCSVIT